jgi:hypothetical protein
MINNLKNKLKGYYSWDLILIKRKNYHEHPIVYYILYLTFIILKNT